MNILLVEDDEYKAADIGKVLIESFAEPCIYRAASVTTALRAISGSDFKVVILDMSLPTFDLSGPGGGGSPQSQGGLEVLRLAKRQSCNSSFVIVTQYPDIELGGREQPLAAAARVLSSKYGVSVRACVLYEYDGHEWREQLRSTLSRC